ncbi:YciI family protein [Sinomonas flava]|uniref:YciI family protein n=1 Tax=Sinomonas flava TaxID=496857 RepID=A0ABN3BL89_9MICC
MAQYMIGMYQPDGVVPPPEFLAPVMARLAELTEELRAAGAFVFGRGLTDASTATVVTAEPGGGVHVTSGPYSEDSEHLGGFDIIEAPDLDTALGWARRFAEITRLPIEVRAFAGSSG